MYNAVHNARCLPPFAEQLKKISRRPMSRSTLGARAGLFFSVIFLQVVAMAEDVRLDAGALPQVDKLDERFQSYNIEMAEVIGGRFWKPYAHMPAKGDPAGETVVGGESGLFEPRVPVDLANRRLRTLAAALGPAYVRVSGTWANTVYFQDDDAAPMESPPAGFRGVLTRAQWRGVVEFSKAVDARIVTSFAINPAVRDTSGSWTPAQALALINYTHAIGGQLSAAELFNEPNFSRQGGGPQQYDGPAFARDSAAFRAFAGKAAPEMKILGPGDAAIDTQGIPGSLTAEDLLASAPLPHFDIFDYHFYGAVSQRCAPPGSPMGTSEEQALSEEWLARTEKVFEIHRELRDRYAPGAPIWITETAGAACGGNPWSATFLDSFRYLDQMGRLAKRGLGAIFHNTLAASEYGLIDQTNLEPRPNYWAALLWRRLMGNVVLDAGPIRPGFHIYANCLRTHKGGAAVLAINTADQTSAVEVSAPADVYALTAPVLTSNRVLLNGRELVLGSDDRIPALLPEHVKGTRVTVAPRSIAFIAIPHAANRQCM
jgi:heparanase